MQLQHSKKRNPEKLSPVFHQENFHLICKRLAGKDHDLKQVLKQYGYPPMWRRTNTFQTLILIILEQQVSLASAFAAFTKLKQQIGLITPVKLLSLSDQELRSCYFSRQKTIYARELAKAFVSKEIQLKKLMSSHDDEIRTTLKKIKGIGDWTVDVYLLFALQRSDIFPTGDLAMIKALKRVKRIAAETTKETIIKIGESWRPYRSVATMILWHYYLSQRKAKV